MKTNILVLAAGPVAFDTHDGGYPLCLAEIEGISILEHVVNNTKRLDPVQYSFSILETDAVRYHLDKVASLLAPGANVFRIRESTRGSACTALLAACQLSQDDELLIISANEVVELDLSKPVLEFRERGLDGGTLTFRSVHPRYSYVRLNHEGYVIEAAQQDPIAQNATAGIFWFRRTSDFVGAAQACIRKDANVDDKFYVAPTFNELILKHKRVGVYPIEAGQYRPLKTERQLQQFEVGGLP